MQIVITPDGRVILDGRQLEPEEFEFVGNTTIKFRDPLISNYIIIPPGAVEYDEANL